MTRGIELGDVRKYKLQEVMQLMAGDDRYIATVFAADGSARIVEVGFKEVRKLLPVVPPTWPVSMLMVRIWNHEVEGDSGWEPIGGIFKAEALWNVDWYRNVPYEGLMYLD